MGHKSFLNALSFPDVVPIKLKNRIHLSAQAHKLRYRSATALVLELAYNLLDFYAVVWISLKGALVFMFASTFSVST